MKYRANQLSGSHEEELQSENSLHSKYLGKALIFQQTYPPEDFLTAACFQSLCMHQIYINATGAVERQPCFSILGGLELIQPFSVDEQQDSRFES